MTRGFALFAGTSPDIIRACAREAEGGGYGSFWVNHPGSIDGLAALAVAAKETQRIGLGVGVIPLHTREPESILAGVRAHGLPLSRLLLGVGSPNPKALARVRGGVERLRSHLSTRLVVAALGPRMCELAGEIADAVLLNWLTPQHARRSTEWIRAGADSAGRQPPRILAYVRLALGPGAEDRVRDEGMRYAGIPAYAAHFARMGVEPLETAICAESPAMMPGALARWHGAVDEVVLRAVPGGDTLEDHLALVQAARPS